MADADDDLSHLIFRVTNLFPGVEDELESILKGVRRMHPFLSDAETKQEQNDEVKIWVEVLKGIPRQVEDAIDKFIDERVRKMRFSQDHHSPHNLREELKQIERKIREISSTRWSHGIGGESSSLFPNQPTSVVGFEKYIEVIKKKLTTGDSRRRLISIVGLIGMGKKTLAWEIYNSNAVKEHFKCCAWVIVSQLYSTEEILQEIAEQVKLYEQQAETRTIRGEKELAQKLGEFLKDNKYLIVMADVLTTQVWDKVKAAFPESKNGSRILFTTRYKEIAKHADRESEIHELKLLSEDESWELFTRMVGVPYEFEQLARELVRNCEGIPLTIVRFGDVLSKKKKDKSTEEEWLRVLRLFHDRRRLWLYIMAMNENKDLPWFLKRCLFYVMYFPENFEIPARRLIALWIAEGLVEDNEYGLSTEDVAETYLTVLINRNLIEVAKQKFDGEVKTCRLPNSQRQLLLSKAKEANFLLSHRNRNPTSSSSSSSSNSSSPSKSMILRLHDHLDKNEASYTHLHGNDPNPSFQPYKYLYSFLSFDNREGNKPGEEIENFLLRGITNRCFQLLRVLDLEGVFKPRLNRVLEKLINLRYLGLRWTLLDELPSSIGKLKFLETLDVKHTYINNLPSSIWKIQRLQHLYLNNCGFEALKGGSLPKLKTLWGVFVDEKSQVKSGLDRSTDLRKLGLSCRSISKESQQALAEWVTKLKYLRSLRLKSSNDSGEPSNLNLDSLSGLDDLSNLYMLGKLVKLFGVHEFPPSLTRLTLSASNLTSDPMQTLEKLPCLRILELHSGSYTGTRMVCCSEGFPQLRLLRIWKLEELEEWRVEKGAMPSIREIEIRFCDKLKKIPDELKHVNTLQKLELTGMPEEFAAEVEKDVGQDWYQRHVKVENVKRS